MDPDTLVLAASAVTTEAFSETVMMMAVVFICLPLIVWVLTALFGSSNQPAQTRPKATPRPQRKPAATPQQRPVAASAADKSEPEVVDELAVRRKGKTQRVDSFDFDAVFKSKDNSA